MTITNGNTIVSADLSPFGNGSDGAFSESSGTTNLTQGTVYRYTSFLLDTSATLSASSTSSKPIIILVDGNCTINGAIDLLGKGCPISFTGYQNMALTISGAGLGFGMKGGVGVPQQKGIKGGVNYNFANDQAGFIMNGTAGGTANGATGGGGGASSQTDGGASGGAAGSGSGGSGGCTLFIMVRGDLTFGASSSIDVSGGAGLNQDGGGGGSGDILIFYNGSLTDNGVTKTKAGGTGDSSGANGAAGSEKIVAYDTIFWQAGGYPT